MRYKSFSFHRVESPGETDPQSVVDAPRSWRPAASRKPAPTRQPFDDLHGNRPRQPTDIWSDHTAKINPSNGTLTRSTFR